MHPSGFLPRSTDGCFYFISMQGILKPFEVRDRRVKEKYDVDDAYLNGWAKKCKAYATAVYNSLCRNANKEQYCWPSLKKIAEEHSMSVRQVSRALSILEKYKILVRERGGKKLNNRYWLTDKSEWTDSPITMDSQSNHHRTDSPIHSKDTQYKDTHIRVLSDDKTAKQSFAAPKDMKRAHEETEFSDSGEKQLDADTRLPVVKEKPRHIKPVLAVKTTGQDYRIISDVIATLLHATGLSKLDGSINSNRRYAFLAVKKFGSPQNVKALIAAAVQDPFHRKNLTSMKYIYYHGVKFMQKIRAHVQTIQDL